MYNVTHLHDMQNVTQHDMVFPGSHNKNTNKRHFRKASAILNDHPRQRERMPAQPGRYKEHAWAQGSTTRIYNDSPTGADSWYFFTLKSWLQLSVYPSDGSRHSRCPASSLSANSVAHLSFSPPIAWLASLDPPIAWLTSVLIDQ